MRSRVRSVFIEENDSSYSGQEFNMWCVLVFLRFLLEGIAKILNIGEH